MEQHPIRADGNSGVPVPPLGQQLKRVVQLSIPAILAQISSMAM